MKATYMPCKKIQTVLRCVKEKWNVSLLLTLSHLKKRKQKHDHPLANLGRVLRKRNNR